MNFSSPHVVHGGSWLGIQSNARCPIRYRNPPVDFLNNLGFRVCRYIVRSCAVRGGSWSDTQSIARLSYRDGLYLPIVRDNALGFRVVKEGSS